jgi:hypothetical protein
VRYLNELNTWMGSFVTNTYGNFQAMSTGVEQLCKELALPTELEDGTPFKPDSIGTAIGDIRRLIDQDGQMQQQFEAIQTSVALLIQQVNTDLQQRAEANARQNQGVDSIRLPNSSLTRVFQFSRPWLPFWKSSVKTRRFFFSGWLLVSQYLVYRPK